MSTASKLLENFGSVLALVKQTHPSIARSIALAACLTTDPEATARQYLKNYDMCCGEYMAEAEGPTNHARDARQGHRAN